MIKSMLINKAPTTAYFLQYKAVSDFMKYSVEEHTQKMWKKIYFLSYFKAENSLEQQKLLILISRNSVGNTLPKRLLYS